MWDTRDIVGYTRYTVGYKRYKRNCVGCKRYFVGYTYTRDTVWNPRFILYLKKYLETKMKHRRLRRGSDLGEGLC